MKFVNGASSLMDRMPKEDADSVPVLRHGADLLRHGSKPLRELIPSRSRDQQPFLRPDHPHVEEFHVLGGLGFRGFDVAEADEDHGAELKALAALHGQDVGTKRGRLTIDE